MKKTVLAAAALTLATGASFAQSSLNLYGVVDLSVESVKVSGKSGITRVSSSNLATSRLGFRGTEDLGGGLKANFVLESQVVADVGASGDVLSAKSGDVKDRFFDRAAWVGLSGGFGAFRIGRMDSLVGAMTGNTSILGNQAYDDFKIAKMVGSDGWRRIDNAVAYAFPEFVPGLKLEAQYSLASGKTVQNETADVDTDKQYGLGASYAAGPLSLGASMLRVKKNAAGTDREGGTVAYGAYDFGAFKLIGYHQQDRDTQQGPNKRKLTGIRVNVPFTADLLLTAGYSEVTHVGYNAANNAKAKILAIKAIYSLSKRTAVYALLTDVNNDAKSALAVAGLSGTQDKDSHGFAVGVRHSF